MSQQPLFPCLHLSKAATIRQLYQYLAFFGLWMGEFGRFFDTGPKSRVFFGFDSAASAFIVNLFDSIEGPERLMRAYVVWENWIDVTHDRIGLGPKDDIVSHHAWVVTAHLAAVMKLDFRAMEREAARILGLPAEEGTTLSYVDPLRTMFGLSRHLQFPLVTGTR